MDIRVKGESHTWEDRCRWQIDLNKVYHVLSHNDENVTFYPSGKSQAMLTIPRGSCFIVDPEELLLIMQLGQFSHLHGDKCELI